LVFSERGTKHSNWYRRAAVTYRSLFYKQQEENA